MSALAIPLTNYINTNCSGIVNSDLISSAGNLLCSFSSAQIASVTSAMFTSAISTLSGISLICPNMASWYSLAKTNPNYGSALYTSISSLSELGSVISGITTADIQLVSADSINSITTNALKYMPAATINVLSSAQLAGLAIDQVSSLLNSPNYASFSSNITSSLQILVTGSSATATTPTTKTPTSSANFNYSFKHSFGLYSFILFIVILY